VITIHQRYRQTDRHTTCDRNTALCTKVHRAVKLLHHEQWSNYSIIYEGAGKYGERPPQKSHFGKQNSCHSPTKFLQPANLTTYTILSLFSLQVELAPCVLSLHLSVSSSLQITNFCFTYASPYLWNQLPSSFRQPHSVHCPPGSPHPTHITFTSSQSPPSLSSPLPLPFTPALKRISFTNPFLHIVTLIPSD